MSAALSRADRDKLVKLLALMSSDHVGERASAALMATRAIKSRGLSWEDVIPEDSRSVYREPVRWQQPTQARPPTTPTSSWIAQIQFVLSREASLTAWERQFAISLGCRSRITPKQADVLVRLVDRLLAEKAA